MVMSEKSLRCFGTSNNFTIIFAFHCLLNLIMLGYKQLPYGNVIFFIKRLITQTTNLTSNMSNKHIWGGGVPTPPKRQLG